MSNNVLDNFSKCFVNNPPEKFIVDFTTTQKTHKRISATAKVGSVLLRASWCCIPMAIVTAPFQNSELTAGIGVAMLASMAVGIGLNITSKMIHKNFVNKNGLTDYINYSIYDVNKRFEKLITKEKNTHEGEREKIGLIKRNLNHLVDLQLTAATQIGIIGALTEDMLQESDCDVRKLIENKKDSTCKLLNSYDYIAKHIASNKELYSKLAPEHKQSIDFSVLHASKLEKLTEPFTSPEYVEKRLELEDELPIATQFCEQEQ